MKIYTDGEYADRKECFKCRTSKLVFYDKKSDFFTCQRCLYELSYDTWKRGNGLANRKTS